MRPPATIRVAVPGDLDVLAAMATQVFLDTYATHGLRSDLVREAAQAGDRARLAARLGPSPGAPDSTTTLIVAERDGHLLGFAELDASTPPPPPVCAAGATGAEVVRLYLLRAAQRQGLGRALVDAADAWAAARGLPGLWLTAWAGNTAALAFYRATGWRDVGRTEHVFEGRAYENRVLVRALPRP